MDIVIHQLNTKLYDNIVVTANSSSPPQNINSFSLYAIQHIWSGASGTWSIIIEGSNVMDGSNHDSDYTVVDITNITSASGNRMVNVEKAGYSKVRSRVAFTSGGGTMSSIINAKVL